MRLERSITDGEALLEVCVGGALSAFQLDV